MTTTLAPPLTDLHRMATAARDDVLARPRRQRASFALGYLLHSLQYDSPEQARAVAAGVDHATSTPPEVEYTLYLCTVCDHDCQSLALSFADWMAQR